MPNDNRENLINQLAASMGAGNFAQTRYEEARYDPDTGTLYCNGYIISHNVIEEALDFFKGVQSKCDMNNSESRHMAMIYQTAIEAIRMMDKSRVKDGGKVVVKKIKA